VHFSWPGNVRQLINAIERAKILSDRETIHLKDLPREVAAPSAAATSCNGSAKVSSLDDLAAIQRSTVVEVLRRERGNKAKAARFLGIDRRKFYGLLENYSIQDAELIGGVQ